MTEVSDLYLRIPQQLLASVWWALMGAELILCCLFSSENICNSHLILVLRCWSSSLLSSGSKHQVQSSHHILPGLSCWADGQPSCTGSTTQVVASHLPFWPARSVPLQIAKCLYYPVPAQLSASLPAPHPYSYILTFSGFLECAGSRTPLSRLLLCLLLGKSSQFLVT